MAVETVVPCSPNTIELDILATPSIGCNTHTGSIKVRADGNSIFKYRLNGNPYQSSGYFPQLSPGNYTLWAKDKAGCETSQLVSIGAGTPGPKFTAVKNLLMAKCSRCHSGTYPPAGKDWSIDCTVTSGKWLIYNRAVIIGDMPRGGPALSAAEKDIITDWIRDGGLIEN
ncbi:MAG: hypothetical protein EOO13_12270 [Chitinophagaceae bacterium]|nr:MAG: hypothetical protein EOO13_12270 [Chitinophagaceae bacterium]